MEYLSLKYKTKRKIIEFLIILFFSVLAFSKTTWASPITIENTAKLINQERILKGLPELILDQDLNNAAELKSKDMINREYFDHFAFGLTPWNFIFNAGYDYLYAGENLAMNFDTAEGMVTAWMNSKAHRENILNPDYTDMGIGIVRGTYSINDKDQETTIVTNMFGRRKPPIMKFFDFIMKNLFNLF